MPTQSSQGFDPALEGNPEGSGDQPVNAEEYALRRIERTPEATVKRVLQQQYLRRTNRGALGANVETEMKRITQGTEKEIEGMTKTLKATDATRMSAAMRSVVHNYERERVAMGMVNKGYIVVDLGEGVAGQFEPGKDRISLDDDVALSPDPQFGLLYGKHVCQHEQHHREKQAKIFNDYKVKAGGQTFRLHPDLVEGQAVVAVNAVNNQNDKQTAEYKRHAQAYLTAAKIIGQKELDDAILSGDIRSLNEAIAKREQEEKTKLAST